MKLYMLVYDNGEQYDGNDYYTIAIFDNYQKAYAFIENKGFEKTDDPNYFQKEPPGGVHLVWGYESITIKEIELNTEIKY